MTRGPNGEKRSADAVGLAVVVGLIATGEEKGTTYVSQNRRKSGVACAEARMKNLSADARIEIAVRASDARWKEKEATMNTHQNPCDAVAAIYATKAEQGLLDVKFLFQNRTEASLTEACKELRQFHEAIEAGLDTELDFGDLNWQ